MLTLLPRFFAIAGLAAGLFLAADPTGSAHEGAHGIVKQRMDEMKSMGRGLKLVGDMLRGKKPFDAAKARMEIAGMRTVTKTIPSLFPKNSRQPMSEAKPEIWSDPEGFRQAAANLNRTLAALEASIGGDRQAALKQYAATVRACSNCHRTYRAEKH